MRFNNQDVYKPYKVMGYVTNVPQELTLFTNVHRSQFTKVKTYIQEGIEKNVDGAFSQYKKGNPRKTITTEEGYIVFAKNITAYRFVEESE